MSFQLENPQSVTFKAGRWSVFIEVISQEGNREQWVASADSYLTDGSGIFFGTKREYEARMEGEILDE